MSEVSFVPLMKAQAKSLRLPVSVMPSADDYHARRKRLGMVREQRLVRRSEAASIRERLAAEPVVVEPPKVAEEVAVEDSVIIPAEPWKRIIWEACETANVTWNEFYSKNRSRRIVKARKEAAYKMVAVLDYSYPAAARRLGYIDHTSAINLARAYARENNLPLGNKALSQFQRDRRNNRIIRSLEMGHLVADVADRERLERQTVRWIAKKMGFDFSTGADAVMAREAEEHRIEAAKKRKAASETGKFISSLHEQRRQEIMRIMPKLAETYDSFSAAALDSGFSRQTIASYAKKMGLKFGANK